MCTVVDLVPPNTYGDAVVSARSREAGECHVPRLFGAPAVTEKASLGGCCIGTLIGSGPPDTVAKVQAGAWGVSESRRHLDTGWE